MAHIRVLSALRLLLRPIIRILLRNGVTWGEFAETGKALFVQVAREDYGIQGRPTNSSRVALKTGLSRREVARVKDLLSGSMEAPVPPRNRFADILSAWHVDARYLDKDQRPALLPATGEGASLASLLSEHVGDIPHGAVIKELEQLGLISRTPDGYRVLARDFILGTADPDMLRQVSLTLHDHASTIAFNVDAARTAPARFERTAAHPAFPQERVAAFEAFVNTEGQAFLERIDAWLVANDMPAGESAHRLHVGVGAYFFCEEQDRRS